MVKNIEQFINEEIINGEGEVTFDYLGKKSIIKAMESYAQYKVNELNKSLPSEADIIIQFPESYDVDPNNGIEDNCYSKRDGARWVVEEIKRAMEKE